MKLYQVILISLSISFVLNCGSANPSKDNCIQSLTDYDKNQGITHCCYFRYKAEKQDEVKSCVDFNKYQFDHLTKYLKNTVYFEVGTEDVNLECGAAYFKLGLLSLILILL